MIQIHFKLLEVEMFAPLDTFLDWVSSQKIPAECFQQQQVQKDHYI